MAAMRSSDKRIYAGFNSMPRNRRPKWLATSPVVPLPQKGSRTTQGTVSALQVQVGCQPRVTKEADTRVLSLPTASDHPFANSLEGFWCVFPRRDSFNAAYSGVGFEIRFHGAPQAEQQPFSEVPAF